MMLLLLLKKKKRVQSHSGLHDSDVMLQLLLPNKKAQSGLDVADVMVVVLLLLPPMSKSKAQWELGAERWHMGWSLGTGTGPRRANRVHLLP